MNRSKAREQLMQLFFQMDIQNNYSEIAEKEFINEYIIDKSQISYIEDLIRTFRDHKEEIDSIIEHSSKNWALKRISKVDLSILRLATAEILYIDDIPDSVAADEAVELAKKFGGKNSSKFINGLIGNIIKNKMQ